MVALLNLLRPKNIELALAVIGAAYLIVYGGAGLVDMLKKAYNAAVAFVKKQLKIK